MAHIHGRPDNEQEHLDDVLGRGPGDPDMQGYPGQEAAETAKTRKEEQERADNRIRLFAPFLDKDKQ